jgi:hypothetical protein
MSTRPWILALSITLPPWRNRLARSAVNRKVGGSSPPGGALLFAPFPAKLLRRNEKKKVWSIPAGFEPAIF